jgi:two-component system, sensor histidine kinase and response regulator
MTTLASILVIDDEPANFDVIESFLLSEPIQLHYASSAERAIARLETLQPDVILLDVMMPGTSGIELCQQLKSTPLWKHIPIIMVTALTSTQDLATCLGAGADDYISKPVNGSELKARIQSMLRIKRQYDQLNELLRSRSDMVNMIVHDLRNPLSTVILSADMLNSMEMSPEKQHRKLEKIMAAGRQLQGLIDDLLIMAKLESGRLFLQRSPVNIAQLCQKALQEFQAIAQQKQLNLVVDLPDSSFQLEVDEAILRRVIDNLVSNAIKFSPKQSTVVLKVDSTAPDGISIQVKDQGKGVQPDLRQHIFKKYETGTFMEGVPQIGLGLAFCKMAIEAHQGSIHVEDNDPVGSVFTIILPTSLSRSYFSDVS